MPLLVFVHGLGGSVSQFASLLTRLSNCAPCLAVDLPGCGRSSFAPQDWAAYSVESLVDLLEVAIAQHRQPHQGIVLIGHSMGCGLIAALARRHQHGEDSSGKTVSNGPSDLVVSGFIAICPATELLARNRVAVFKSLLCIPTAVFDIWRTWDARGGPNSPSVRRFVGSDADEESKLLQEKFNRQSRTSVWRRMAWGCLPRFASGMPLGGLPGRGTWESLDLPVCLVAGESDHITPPAGTKKIFSDLVSSGFETDVTGIDYDDSIADAVPSALVPTLPATPAVPSAASSMTKQVADALNQSRLAEGASAADDDDSTLGMPSGTPDTVDVPPLQLNPLKFVEFHVLPSPACHALLYTPATVGIVSGIVSNFLARRVTGRLDRGWQLRFLSREGKWDIKNFEKWTRVEPISKPIAGIFRAMKTLRQVDAIHSPERFVKDWAGIVGDIIDVSHDNPVYDPRDLETGGIYYHKFPTVSKIPPTASEVDMFNALVDRIRSRRAPKTFDAAASQGEFIGVHCHYGFNRTGYFLVCYLVDRCNYTLQGAIDAFAEARPAGIRHSHFLDSLSLRYGGVTEGI